MVSRPHTYRGRTSAFGAGLFFVCVAVWGVSAYVRSHRTRPVIAFIPPTTGSELWDAMHAAAKSAAGKRGFEIYWNAPTRSDDIERQIQLIQEAVQRHESGLIVAPVESRSLMSPLIEARAGGVPVVVVSTQGPVAANRNIAYVLNDDAATGRMLAEQVGTALNGTGRVGMVGVDPRIGSAATRAAAFEERTRLAFPGLTLLKQGYGAQTYEEATEMAERLILAHPHLDAIVGFSTVDTEGALTAIRIQRVRTTILLIGCDQELDLMQGIREGTVRSIVAQNSYAIGTIAVAEILAQRRGEGTPDPTFVSPVLINRQNIDRADIQRLLSGNWYRE